MSISSDTLLSGYVPLNIRQKLSRGPEQFPFLWTDQGVVLFADISGFTRLTEKLVKSGPEGIETLRATLNQCFGTLLEVIERWGGDVIKFAGDAVLAVWSRALLPEPNKLLLYRAMACALEMQALNQTLARQSATPLRLKMGLEWGDLLFLHLQHPQRHWECLLSGPAVAGAFTAEAQAAPGQVVLGSEALQWAPAQSRFKTGAVLEFLPFQALPADARPTHPPLPDNWLLHYLPEVVRYRLAAGQQHWLAELRPVSVLFLLLPELGPEQLPLWLARIQDKIALQGGTINKINLDQKGVSLLVVFGLPPASHENNAQRAVATALDLHQLFTDHRLHPSQGIATGRAFCGEIGSDWRREYTLIGDVVNTAARLMQATVAPIVVDRNTWILTRNQFEYEQHEPLLLKGKYAPLDIFVPYETLEHHPVDQLQIGRTAETEQLLNVIGQTLREYRSGLILLEGEAGIGKSTLLARIRNVLTRRGTSVLAAEGDERQQHTAGLLWQEPFCLLLGLDTHLSGAQRLEQLHDRISFYPHLQVYLPLLGPVLGIDIPDNSTTAAFQGETRIQNRLELMTALIRDSVSAEPLLLTIDDTQWLDLFSWRLLDLLYHEVPGLMLLLVSRPESTEDTPPEILAIRQRLKAGPYTRQVGLGRMEASEIGALVANKLGIRQIPEALTQLIAKTAEGHPFFSQELAYNLREQGYIQIHQGLCRLTVALEELDKLQLPGSIEGVILSRIDRLSPVQQLALKIASVIGRQFDFKALYDLYPVLQDREMLLDALRELEQMRMIRLGAVFPGLIYHFRHNLTHQAIYALILPEQRRELHAQIAQWLEQELAQEQTVPSLLLAHHWIEAKKPEHACHYLRLAGQTALQEGLYQQARFFLLQSLQYAGFESDRSWLAVVHQALGEAYYGLGHMHESQRHLQKSLVLAGWPRPPLDLSLKQLVPQIVTQIKYRFKAPPAWKEAQEKLRLMQAARTSERLGPVYVMLGEKAQALYNALLHVNLCEEAGTDADRARAYGHLGWIGGWIGQRQVAEYYLRKALTLARSYNDPFSLAWVYQLYARYCLTQAQWESAEVALQASLPIFTGVHDQRHHNESLLLLAQVCFYQGHFERAEGLGMESIRQARQRGDHELECHALLFLGHLKLTSNHLPDALNPVRQALALGRASGGRQWVYAVAVMLQIALVLDDFEQADTLATELSRAVQDSAPADSLWELSYLSSVMMYQCACLRQERRSAYPTTTESIRHSFQEFAHRCLPALPRCAYLFGIQALLEGQMGAGQSHLKKALKLAQKLGISDQIQWPEQQIF
jgi:class 3 adenylate cyclase/tetratricopeptide (TPR) repeat protein